MHKSVITANIILYCKEWDATVCFYRDGLQLPILFSVDWFIEFSLTETSRLSIADEKHASVKSCKGAGITLTLQVQDIDAAREFTANMGLKPTEVKTHPWSARLFYIFDPEGHRIEMWQSSDSAKTSRLRARAKITSHFNRPCIPLDGVAKIRNMLDIS